jgi:hypothetical protein
MTVAPMRREPFQRRRRGGLVRDAIRQLDQPVALDEAPLGIAAEHHTIGHTVTLGKIAHTRTDGLDGAHAFHAERHRKLAQGIGARALVDVNEIEPDGTVTEAHLTGSGIADLDLLPAHLLRPTGRVDTYRVARCHVPHSSKEWGWTIA